MRSKLPAESGFSRCKDAIKSPCQPSTTLPPWGGVVHEGLCRRSDRSRVPGHGLGRGDPGHARGSAPRAADACGGCRCARALQPRRPPLEGSRVGRAARAQDVRLELLARGRGRGGGPPGQRLAGGAPDRAAGGSARSSGRGRRGASRCECAAGSAGCAPTTSGAPRNRWVGRSRWRAAPRSSPARPGAPTSGSAATVPSFARTLTTAVVHHTAGGEPSTPAQSAAVVRGIYLYHVRGNGWDDVGYNFLVDRFGQVFEGPVRGRRAQRDRRALARVQHRAPSGSR